MTLVGHSFGSLLSSDTLLHNHLHVDNFVAQGSPGLDTMDGLDYNIAREHVYNETANADTGSYRNAFNYPGYHPVSLARFSKWYGGDPDRARNIVQLSNSNISGSYLGALIQADGHSDYLKKHTVTLYNTAAVVEGKGYEIRK